MREAVKLCNVVYWDVIFKQNPSAYLQAVWAWTAHRDVFERAKKLIQVNHSPYSRKRSGLPIGDVSFSDDKLGALKRAIQSFFLDKQDRGKVCTVEAFEKGNGKHCIFAYPDDRPVPKLYHDAKEELRPRVDTSVFSVLFLLDTAQGTLELSAKLSKPLREELENLFIRTIYGIEPPPVFEPTYNLDLLKNPKLVLATEPCDCLAAEVSFLTVKWLEIDSTSSFGSGRKGNFVRPIKHLLGYTPQELKASSVRNAIIRFHFHPKPDRKAGILCAEFTSPTNLVIRCKDLQRVETMQYYLKKWGMINDT